MICYRDRTYCIRACANIECDRNVTEEVREAAQEMELGIAFGDLKTDRCGYEPSAPKLSVVSDDEA